MLYKFSKSAFLLLLNFSSPCLIYAQGTTDKVVNSTDNLLATVMIIIAVVLIFVIWGMGQVLLTLTKQMAEKSKQSSKSIVSLLIIGMLLSSTMTSAQTNTAAAVVKSGINYGGMDSTGFWLLASVISLEVIAILFLLFFIKRIEQELLPASTKKSFLLGAWWSNMDKKIFTKAVSVEKEADILLDHNYDGIKELDNALPPWWKYGFYITIVVAVIYLLNFHVFRYGKNPTEEYQAELEKAKIESAEYESKNVDKINETNIQMPLKAGLDEGKEIFTSICWTCHGKLGEGGVGPNLTDDYWIHKGSLNDIYTSIKIGYPEKGMQSWEKNYTAKQINNLTGYIKTLRGTNPPNPKLAQGDLFAEDSSGVIKISKDTIPKLIK